MTTLRPFTLNDLYKFNAINLDVMTETYCLPFYMKYALKWPLLFQVAEAPNGDIMGYIIAKTEGAALNYHGHVTALTISPTYRRIGLASLLMATIEQQAELKCAFFIDLFVRVTNAAAIKLYQHLGYSFYRRILDYYIYETNEDAFDLRKALKRDVHKKSTIPVLYPVRYDDSVDRLEHSLV